MRYHLEFGLFLVPVAGHTLLTALQLYLSAPCNEIMVILLQPFAEVVNILLSLYKASPVNLVSWDGDLFRSRPQQALQGT